MKIQLPVLSCVLYLTAVVSSQSPAAAVVEVSSESPDCTLGLQSCVQVFMDNILQHVDQQNSELLCQDLQTFTKCVFDQKCNIPENQRRAFIENVQKEMKKEKFECDIGDTHSTTERSGSNSNGENINRASLFVFFITAMIMFMSLKLSH